MSQEEGTTIAPESVSAEAAPQKAELPSRETPQTQKKLDPRSIRRAEIKKQKRRAHRHRINASNRPG